MQNLNPAPIYISKRYGTEVAIISSGFFISDDQFSFLKIFSHKEKERCTPNFTNS
jgi:hypothetical protein